jgi:large subunit ribosomal protein L20
MKNKINTTHRNLRKSHIIKLNNSCKLYGISYSRFIKNLRDQNIRLNREILPLLAIYEPKSFKKLIG